MKFKTPLFKNGNQCKPIKEVLTPIWGKVSRPTINSIKGTGHYWYLLKIIVSIKTYLVTSNGGWLIVCNTVRNGSLWNNVVFEKEVICHSNIKRLLAWNPLQASKRSPLCSKGMFSFIFLLQLQWPIESKISQVCFCRMPVNQVTITKGVQCL